MDNEATREKLYIFNLSTDLENPILAATHDWIEEFSQNYREIEVYSTHVGRYLLPNSVTVHELDGGSLRKKLRNITRLFALTIKIIQEKKKTEVFHHMSSRTLLLIGLPLRLFNVPQGIWYSHSHLDFSFRIGKTFANHVFTSTVGSIPYSSVKTHYVGHGIKTSQVEQLNGTKEREGIVALGRISRIKNLDQLLLSFQSVNIHKPVLHFIGPVTDEKLKNELQNLAAIRNVVLTFPGVIPHEEVTKTLRNFKYIYSGTPSSVDKALLEGALAGCLVLSANPETLALSGMKEIWLELGYQNPPSLSDQYEILEDIDSARIDLIRKKLVELCRSKNDLTSTIEKISIILSTPKSVKEKRCQK